MARTNLTHKPGEKAPAAGTYYCYVCSLQGIDSTCEMKTGQVFTECSRCLERKVAEWDLTWKSVVDRPGARPRPRMPLLWPGSLTRPA